MVVLAAIWGSSYLFIKIGVRDLSPAMVAWARTALGAAVLVPLAARAGALRGLSDRAGTLIGVALVQVAGPFLLIGAGEEEISSSLAGILVASAPLFTALLAISIDSEERSEGFRLVGVLAGLAGVCLLLGLDLGSDGSQLLGGLAVVLASLGYAIGGLLVKHRLGGMQPIGLAAWVMVASTVALAPAGILTAPDAAPGIGPVAAVTALGVLGTGVAFAIFYDLIATVGPARSFIVTYLAPGFAVVYGVTLLGESISVATIAGLALILGGSYLAVEGRLPGRRTPRATEIDQPLPAARSEGATR